MPVWQLLGGKFRDRVRIYCDTDSEGGGRDMGKALRERMAQGYTFSRWISGSSCSWEGKGCLSAPLGFLEKMREYKEDGLFDAARFDRSARDARRGL